LCTQQLRALGITHVLNAAQKEVGQEPGYYVNTSPQYYRRVGIEFLGIPATDSISFNLSPYFEKAASFIDSALHTNGEIDSSIYAIYLIFLSYFLEILSNLINFFTEQFQYKINILLRLLPYLTRQSLRTFI